MQTHIHKYRFESKETNCHKHKILGYTDYMIGIGALHFHTFYGISSHMGHVHCFSGFTGFPVKTYNGHIHKMEGCLEPVNMHQHIFYNYTDEDVGYISKSNLDKAYV
ncbi:hypothetical protein RBH29_10250 [Herbivorax sp. ANBcel31]|uniref:hypothetical protein n=1 Tax=Herbivorax sp. ANBcel31 TaxID=3069754 RepID=UPI0027B5EAFA|nr:hypothetical protein [Herbivorax sp. ANBcel31]MDQ2086805.1 hypothetical protein [Herbivorax sp. ANBcel31]